MHLALAHLLWIVLLLSPAGAQATAGESSSAGAWGGLLWIVPMVVVTIALVGVALTSLRSRTRD